MSFEESPRPDLEAKPESKERSRHRAHGRLPVRERLKLLLDPGSLVEDGQRANSDPNLPGDGVVTGVGKIEGRAVAVMANDPAVKAGSWGRLTVEKILRVQETARAQACPLVYLVDSAGARITEQLEMFPGRRGAGRIFQNQVQMSGQVPQVCVLFGPSTAGGAYVPAFCDVVIMVEGQASMSLGSPRMAEVVIGEKVTLEQMGGARMHCETSGCGDVLVKSDAEAIETAKAWLRLMPSSCAQLPSRLAGKAPVQKGRVRDLIPADQNKPFDMQRFVDALVDPGTWLEVKALYARELLTGLCRLGGQAVGVVASQPKYRGGILFAEAADKAARFVELCDAYHLPLLFLADVPGFMIGTRAERTGIIRAGAKMISAVAEATVPKISVVVRKAYGAGLYAFAGPGLGPDCTLALPKAMIAVMGPEAAVNAVYYKKIQDTPPAQRAAYVERLRTEYRAEIDLSQLAAELVIDEIVEPDELRANLARRFDLYSQRSRPTPTRKHGVHPA